MTAKPSDQSAIDKVKREAQEVEQEVSSWTVVSYGKALFARFSRDHTTVLAAGVAYNLVFALPPLLIFLLTMAAVTQYFTGVNVAESLQNTITQNAPANTQDLLNELVTNAISKVNGTAVSIGAAVAILLALYGASSAINSLVEAFNMAYDVKDTRSFFKKRGIVLGLTILFVVVIIAAFVLFVFGQRIGLEAANYLGLSSTFSTVWNIVRVPAAILLFMALLALLYYWGPDVDQSFRWVSPGSVAATVLWVLALLGFRLYVSLSNPGSAYGVAGSVIVLLFFLYITALILILGLQINAVFQKRNDPETQQALAVHPQVPAPGSATEVATSRQPAGQSRYTAATAPAPSSRSVAMGDPESESERHSGLGKGILAGGLVSLAVGALAKARIGAKRRA